MTVSESKHDVVDDEDQLEKLMKHTGCLELHYKIQVRSYNICTHKENSGHLIKNIVFFFIIFAETELVIEFIIIILVIEFTK